MTQFWEAQLATWGESVELLTLRSQDLRLLFQVDCSEICDGGPHRSSGGLQALDPADGELDPGRAARKRAQAGHSAPAPACKRPGARYVMHGKH